MPGARQLFRKDTWPPWVVVLSGLGGAIVRIGGDVEFVASTLNSMTLTLIRDWAPLVLTVAGVAWLGVTSLQPKRRKNSEWVAGMFLAIVVFFVSALSYAVGTEGTVNKIPENDIVHGWGLGPDGLFMILKTAPLLDRQDEFQLMVVSRAADNTIDPLKDTKIIKSNMFKITGERVRIVIRPSEAIKLSMGKGVLVDLFALLVPRAVNGALISNAQEVTDLGGEVLAVKSMQLVTEILRVGDDKN